MESNEWNPAIMSNLHVFMAIAKNSLLESQKISGWQRKPKPNGQPGHISRFDPEQQSFKQSLIAIVFSGIYLEALLYLEGLKQKSDGRLSKEFSECFEKMKYEKKLKILGISDSKLLGDCQKFREVRNDLVHEKPMKNKGPVAQVEAEKAVAVIERITNALKEQNN